MLGLFKLTKLQARDQAGIMHERPDGLAARGWFYATVSGTH